MIGKIKLTQEQAEAVKAILGECNEDVSQAIDDHADVYNNPNDRWVTVEFQPLNDLPPSDLARALLIGYEAEPEPEPLKVGDWAKYTTRGDKEFIGKIHEIENGNRAWGHWDDSKTYGFIYLDELVKMTPEEIEHQKWAEIEPGDVLIGKGSGRFAVFVKDNYPDEGIEVGLSNYQMETWRKDKVELYAKKVGGADAKDN